MNFLKNSNNIIILLAGLVDRQRFKRKGREFCCWIQQNHLWNQYVLEGVMTSSWNMMSKNLELTRKFCFYSLNAIALLGFVGVRLFDSYLIIFSVQPGLHCFVQ